MRNQIRRLFYITPLLTALAGCGGPKTTAPVPEMDPDALPSVSCKVLLDGEPVGDVVVELRGRSKNAPKVISQYSDEGEVYSFQTLQGKTRQWGVPEGEYDVIVKPAPGAKTRIPSKYSNPKSSGLTAEIHAGANDLPPFELTN